jgi:outer membrane protein TolC
MKLFLNFTAAMLLALAAPAIAQDMSAMPTPLAGLIAEAEANNAQISAANHAWKAATHAAPQVTTLPDPQLTLQSFSVGSPKPFAGFSNSDFAYIGFGASQDLPYPGKLRLRGDAANSAAEAQHAQAEMVGATIAEQVKLMYIGLAYHQATLAILQRNDEVLQPMIQSGLSRYSVGQGSQADVVRSQLEHTKLLREITMHHEEMDQMQADLKLLLHRAQSSPDIVAEPLAATPLRISAQDLQTMVQQHNPAVHANMTAVQQQTARLDSKPDFSVGYEFQQTGSGYRDYYMLTLNMRLPRRKRVQAEVAQAGEMLDQSKQELDQQLQQQLAEVQKQAVAVADTAELLKEFQEGLLPQAESAFHLEQAAYQNNTQQFAPVLASLLDLLSLEHDYHQVLLDHETSLVHLETLTGADLR